MRSIAKSSPRRHASASSNTPSQAVHPVQRCVSTRQITKNIFEIETAAQAECTCMSEDSGNCSQISLVRASYREPWLDLRGHWQKQAFLHFCTFSLLKKRQLHHCSGACWSSKRSICYGKVCQTRTPCQRFSVHDGCRLHLQMASWHGNSEGSLPTTVVAAHSMRPR